MGQQQLSPEDLHRVRQQITALSAPPQVPVSSPFTPTPYAQPTPQSIHPVQQPYQPSPHVPQSQTPTSQAFLDSQNLAEIMARAQRAQATPSTPHVSLPQNQPTPTTLSSQSAPTDLLASLRAQGVLPAGLSTPVNGSSGYYPPSVTNTPSIQSTNTIAAPSTSDLEITSASLKKCVLHSGIWFNALLSKSRPRPYLVSALYEARPNQCTTCGKRFLATEEGRKKKARHLDWHFRTNQRLAESAKRGQSRSWYVDELVRTDGARAIVPVKAYVGLGMD